MKSIGLGTFVILIFFGCFKKQEKNNVFQDEANLQEIIQSKNKISQPEFEYSIIDGGTFKYSTGVDTKEFLNQIEKFFYVQIDSIENCIDCDTYSRIFYIQEDGKTIFSAEPDWDNPNKIFRFKVLDQRFKTDLNIGIGSTFKELKEKYEIIDIDISGEYGAHAIAKDFNGSFGLEITESDDWWDYNKDNYPEESRINEIIVL